MTVDGAVGRVVAGPERTLRLVDGGRGTTPTAGVSAHAHPREEVHGSPPQAPPPQVPALSAREKEVLLAWFRSDSKATAAAELFISVGTLNTHLARVRAKYARVGRAASTKAALVVRALQDGLVSLEEW